VLRLAAIRTTPAANDESHRRQCVLATRNAPSVPLEINGETSAGEKAFASQATGYRLSVAIHSRIRGPQRFRCFEVCPIACAKIHERLSKGISSAADDMSRRFEKVIKRLGPDDRMSPIKSHREQT